jgi:hypothetical protein
MKHWKNWNQQSRSETSSGKILLALLTDAKDTADAKKETILY